MTDIRSTHGLACDVQQHRHHRNVSSITGTASIARLLDNVSQSTVRRLIKAGLLRASKMPGRGRNTPWRVERSEIARFRELMRTGGIELHMEAAE